MFIFQKHFHNFCFVSNVFLNISRVSYVFHFLENQVFDPKNSLQFWKPCLVFFVTFWKIKFSTKKIVYTSGNHFWIFLIIFWKIKFSTQRNSLHFWRPLLVIWDIFSKIKFSTKKIVYTSGDHFWTFSSFSQKSSFRRKK